MSSERTTALNENPQFVFYAIGALSALYGLGLWIVYYVYRDLGYPGAAHASLQIAGFFLSFVFGALVQALRRGGAPPIGNVTLAALAGCYLAAIVAIPLSALLAQALLLAVTVYVLVYILSALAGSTDRHAIGWRYTTLGLCAALYALGLGALIEAGAFGAHWLFWRHVSHSLLFVAAPAALMLGVTKALSPGRSRGPVWLRLALLTLFCLLSFAEGRSLAGLQWTSDAALHLIYLTRAVLFAALALLEFTPLSAPRGGTTVDWCHWLAWNFVTSGLILQGVWPEYRIAWEHWVFVGGYTWLLLLHVTQLLAGAELQLRRRSVIWTGVWLMAAMSTRVSTDIWSSLRLMHLGWASLFLFLAAWVWIRAALRARRRVA
ncbi:MAG TPA: hypothetical protein VLB27_05555 [candidate division Zixibacteria bacterium]|nr:hypothetical protein [candidate division Zixibacteria bacterium]